MEMPDLLDLLSKGNVRRFDPGEHLFRQGDPATAIFVVEEGRLRLLRHLEDGTTVALHTARGGETFAEAALFADAYHCDAVAEVESRVRAIPKTALLEALGRDPALGIAFMRLLAGHVRELRGRVELRNVRSAQERLLAWLRMQAVGSPAAVRLDRTWTEVAAELGLTREAVYRALARLEREGAVLRRGDGIVLGPPRGV